MCANQRHRRRRAARRIGGQVLGLPVAGDMAACCSQPAESWVAGAPIE